MRFGTNTWWTKASLSHLRTERTSTTSSRGRSTCESSTTGRAMTSGTWCWPAAFGGHRVDQRTSTWWVPLHQRKSTCALNGIANIGLPVYALNTGAVIMHTTGNCAHQSRRHSKDRTIRKLSTTAFQWTFSRMSSVRPQLTDVVLNSVAQRYRVSYPPLEFIKLLAFLFSLSKVQVFSCFIHFLVSIQDAGLCFAAS